MIFSNTQNYSFNKLNITEFKTILFFKYNINPPKWVNFLTARF